MSWGTLCLEEETTKRYDSKAAFLYINLLQVHIKSDSLAKHNLAFDYDTGNIPNTKDKNRKSQDSKADTEPFE